MIVSASNRKNRKSKARDFYYHTTGILSGRNGADLHNGVPFVINDGKTILGLRVCSIKLNCGLDNVRLLRALDSTVLPHLVPWQCQTEPTLYQDGRYIVIEAQWPPGYEVADIRLDDISTPNTRRSDRVVVGVNALGTNITLMIHDICHLLVAGQTGSGKSYTLRSLVQQIGDVNRYSKNMLVLLDGKGGEGLGIVSGISPYQVGPLATRPDDIINALGWCIVEMNRRYDIIMANGGVKLSSEHYPHIIIVFDEFQRLTKGGSNSVVTEQMNILATQGRAANIHVTACTQKPLQESWGDPTTRDQFDGVICQKVKDRHASEAAMGSTYPKCHKLLPHGDAYVQTHAPYVLDRVQVAYIPEDQLTRLGGCQPINEYWPEYDYSGIEKLAGRPRIPPNNEQIAVGIEAVVTDKRREWFRRQLTGDVPGAGRADRILGECDEIVQIMTRRGVSVSKEDHGKR